MGARQVVAAMCAVMGVALLAGLGWALLAVAFVLFISSTPQSVIAIGQRLVAVGRWAAESPVRVAVTAMPPAVVVLTVGMGLVFGVAYGVMYGIAAAMITLGVSVGGLSLLVGWDQAVE